MKRLLSLAILFFPVLFLLPSPPVTAQTPTPNCARFRIIDIPVQRDDRQITVAYAGSESLASVPYAFLYEYQGGAQVSDRVMGDADASKRFEFSVSHLTGSQATVSLVPFPPDPSNATRYCSIRISLDPESQEIIVSSPANQNSSFAICKQAGDEDSAARALCQECFNQEGIWTAIGCIPFAQTTQTVRSLMVVGLGISGVVVVLMTLYGSFLMSTSQGDPKRVEEAKSALSSAVFGLLFVIFSVAILRFIGVNILRLPEFG